ncbi:MmgE/PrpD family protein [Methylobacterium nodulans]|uniref:MmgE/PrpD family protein n=1 Tax=Methylobacterium nodulans (strain LMG 21967 / CNCM I-2342 / ORS 2060) TaxID=460265 RepID=B8IWQ8_METNO|nr:MmgE/PrpD family protein [Methylobacterium nodulans]ACL62949.1 MmgE/PrpD family protein [Methylobacterium nodulans ORS 2060]
MTIARSLARRVRALARDKLPPAVDAAARLHLLDAIGVGLAAAASEAGAPYRRYAAGVARGGPAPILGLSATAAPADAALVNGGLIHGLEFDDTHTGSIVHGSAVLAPAALAAGQAAGSSGAAVLSGYALGWEALIRIGLAAPGAFQAWGFQITSVGGALVAALIAAELAGLSEDETVAAVGIALSGASGGFEFLTNGASVKSLHPGFAAHAGLTAAALAQAGLTGPETAFEGRCGLFAAFAGDARAAEAFAASLDDLGTVWHLQDAAFKFHPCCHYLHPFVEAAGMLAARGVEADDIASLTCRVPAGAGPVICEPWEAKQAPVTGHAARWSLPVVVAARLVEGRVDLATFEAPAGEAVRALSRRIGWEPLAGARFPAVFEAEILALMRDGEQHHVRVDDVYGNAGRPAEAAAVREKFRSNAARALASDAIRGVEAAVDELTAAPSLDALEAALSKAASHPARSDA